LTIVIFFLLAGVAELWEPCCAFALANMVLPAWGSCLHPAFSLALQIPQLGRSRHKLGRGCPVCHTSSWISVACFSEGHLYPFQSHSICPPFAFSRDIYLGEALPAPQF